MILKRFGFVFFLGLTSFALQVLVLPILNQLLPHGSISVIYSLPLFAAAVGCLIRYIFQISSGDLRSRNILISWVGILGVVLGSLYFMMGSKFSISSVAVVLLLLVGVQIFYVNNITRAMEVQESKSVPVILFLESVGAGMGVILGGILIHIFSLTDGVSLPVHTQGSPSPFSLYFGIFSILIFLLIALTLIFKNESPMLTMRHGVIFSCLGLSSVSLHIYTVYKFFQDFHTPVFVITIVIGLSLIGSGISSIFMRNTWLKEENILIFSILGIMFWALFRFVMKFFESELMELSSFMKVSLLTILFLISKFFVSCFFSFLLNKKKEKFNRVSGWICFSVAAGALAFGIGPLLLGLYGVPAFFNLGIGAFFLAVVLSIVFQSDRIL